MINFFSYCKDRVCTSLGWSWLSHTVKMNVEYTTETHTHIHTHRNEKISKIRRKNVPLRNPKFSHVASKRMDWSTALCWTGRQGWHFCRRRVFLAHKLGLNVKTVTSTWPTAFVGRNIWLCFPSVKGKKGTLFMNSFVTGSMYRHRGPIQVIKKNFFNPVQNNGTLQKTPNQRHR